MFLSFLLLTTTAIFTNSLFVLVALAVFSLTLSATFLFQQGTLQSPQVFFLAFLALSFPITGYLTGILLERFSNLKDSKVSLKLSPLALLLSVNILLNSGSLFDYFGQALLKVSVLDSDNLTRLFIKLFTSVFFCASLASSVIMTVVLLAILSANFLLRASGVKKGLEYSFYGVRSVLLLTLVAWSINLITDLVAENFSLARLF